MQIAGLVWRANMQPAFAVMHHVEETTSSACPMCGMPRAWDGSFRVNTACTPDVAYSGAM